VLAVEKHLDMAGGEQNIARLHRDLIRHQSGLIFGAG
jgi:hypothetical protein